MKRALFHDNWSIQQDGEAARAVTLPHDALFETPVKAENSRKKGFFTNGTWTYLNTFHAPEEWQEKYVALEFEGVYNHARIYVNGSLVTQRPNGYVEFLAELKPFLKYGEENIIKVIAQSGDLPECKSAGGRFITSCSERCENQDRKRRPQQSSCIHEYKSEKPIFRHKDSKSYE